MVTEQTKKAYILWLRHYHSRHADEEVSHYLSVPSTPHSFGKLKRAREALLLSTGSLAEKLKISRAAYSKLENSEAEGTITLARLQSAAEAMDCELLYVLRPKKKKRFSEMIWDVLCKEAIQHPWVVKRPKLFQHRALAGIAKQVMGDPQFRQRMGWNKRH